MQCPACNTEIGFPWRLVVGLRHRSRCRDCGAELKLASVPDGIIRGLPVVLAIGLILWLRSEMETWLAFLIAMAAAEATTDLVAFLAIASRQVIEVKPGESLRGAYYVWGATLAVALSILLILITQLPEHFQ